jgi:two-component sensor histidine kinase
MLERMHAARRPARGSEPGKTRRKLARVSTAEAHIAEEVERRTAELRAELELQHRRLREMGHRVKNNLQTLSALTLLKARRTQEESARQALLGMAERIGALSIAYRIADPSNEDRVDAKALVSEIAAELAAGLEGKRIALSLDLEPVLVPTEAAAPLALLANELIGNMLRHGFSGRRVGKLAVSARTEGAGTRLVIAAPNLNRLPEEEAGVSFWRTLCEMFARQIKAELTFEDAAQGMRAVVLLPAEGR